MLAEWMNEQTTIPPGMKTVESFHHPLSSCRFGKRPELQVHIIKATCHGLYIILNKEKHDRLDRA